MERPLEVSQPPAGTHCESGPDATPICPKMLRSLLSLTPARFTPKQVLSEGLNDVQRLTRHAISEAIGHCLASPSFTDYARSRAALGPLVRPRRLPRRRA